MNKKLLSAMALLMLAAVFGRRGGKDKQDAQEEPEEKAGEGAGTAGYACGEATEVENSEHCALDSGTAGSPNPADGYAYMTFSSFDGGGPVYTATIADPGVVSCYYTRSYGNPDHASVDGAAYNVRFELRGLKPGETRLTVSARSPIAENWDRTYRVTVDEEKRVRVELIEEVENLET
ncbi:MAG: hypothetical protein II803_00325 [Firmicutes bacterium]|nr:hypothetical protein [Bacillota bacterium]